MATEPRGPGGIALRAWLDQSGMNIPAFAERLGIDRVHLQRMVSGERVKRVNRALAVLIERETSGAVPRSIWYGDEADDDTTDTAAGDDLAPTGT